MRPSVLPTACAVSIFFLSSCSPAPADGEQQIRWRSVLDLKRKAIATANANAATATSARQAYADALASFLEKYPQHARAAEVYRQLEIQFARELVQQGRYEDAMHQYREVLAAHPDAREAGSELAQVADRMAISRSELAAITGGMPAAEVEQRIGPPRQGWKKRVQKNGRTTECWYYRAADGGLASVFIAGGKVFATDYAVADQKARASAALK